MPHRFGDTKLEKVNIFNLDNTLGIVLRCAANRIQINGTLILESCKSLRAHAAFADDRANTEFANNISLVGLFPATCRWAGGIHEPLVALLEGNRTTMIECSTLEIDG